MPLNARGLTLVEVVLATAIVLVTCMAVTTVTVTAAQAGDRARHALEADDALQGEAARLRSLPFFAPLPAGWPASRALPAPSAVGELFPHADETLHDEGASYVATGELAGAFVSSAGIGDGTGAQVRRTTWMARCAQGGWRLLSAAEVAGWRGWSSEVMPGEALVVVLEAAASLASPWPSGSGGPTGSRSPSGTGRVRSLMLVLTATGGLEAVGPEGLESLDAGPTP